MIINNLLMSNKLNMLGDRQMLKSLINQESWSIMLINAETEDTADKFTEIEDDLIAIPVQKHINDYLKDEDMTLKDLAEELNMSTYNLSMYLNDYDHFGKEFLIDLAHATGTSDEYWINLQNQYLNMRNKIEKIRKGKGLEND